MATSTPSAAASRQAVARSQVLDDLIMGTNSSSIVSKRSVERLYYPNEPHFFRYFVKKLQRRAPLINRGYWLRLRAIDVIVRHFLARESPKKKKVVINLGCGSDVLPWQCHARYGASNDGVLFVDVDYPDLLRKKRAIVLETPQLREILGSSFVIGESEHDCTILRSDRYCQLACDLRELDVFRKELESFLDLDQCEFLFVAEVSITYMDTQSADALIQWASSIGPKAEFCLLEQMLPLGPGHPFAQTMLAHFNKLSTPLKSVAQYPTLSSQEERFQSRGWKGVKAWDLWQAWEGDAFVSTSEKLALDLVEPFDEWEEFVLFCRHYLVLHASSTHTTADATADVAITGPAPTKAQKQQKQQKQQMSACNCLNLNSRIEITKHQSTSKVSKRRFGNAMAVHDAFGQRRLLHLMGLDSNGRAATCDAFSLDGDGGPGPSLPLKGPLPRVCFTLTDLGNLGVLLVGGRTSPTVSLSDCWLFERGAVHRWVPMQALPVPLFRHSAVRLGDSSLVLVAGGKTGPSKVSGDFYLFHPSKGWSKCQVTSELSPVPFFGAILCNTSRSDSRTEPGIFRGILAGGLNQYGHFDRSSYLWKIDANSTSISFSEAALDEHEKSLLSVFGASVVELGATVAICGGVGADASLQGCNISTLAVMNDDCRAIDTVHTHAGLGSQPIPFMIGSSTLPLKDGIIVVGGGATCFSMGTYWETGIFQIRLPSNGSGTQSLLDTPRESLKSQVEFLESYKYVAINQNAAEAQETSSTSKIITTSEIQRVKLSSAEQFQEVLRSGRPVIFEGLHLGRCVQTWTPPHVVDRIGSDKKVIVHECHKDSEKMDFTSKNFSYIADTFGNVMDRVQSGGRLYMRSLSGDKPSEIPAQIEDDFPLLAAEFSLPPQLEHVNSNKFSSVLRISGRVNMWLHYDVMANVYAQITGSKRMILFPPSDVKHLSFAPGASSSGLDVFADLDPSSTSSSSSLAQTHPHEALLHPGDLLFLPALWLHTATPLTDMSIAVNVFFRDLEDHQYASGRDVYGNKDLEAYEKGRVAAARIGKAFQQMPQETRRFYLTRIADELLQAAEEG